MVKNYPRYRMNIAVIFEIGWSTLTGKHRDFRQDAARLFRGVSPVHISGVMPKLSSFSQGAIVTVNHYYRRGFQSWWIALAVAAQFEENLHWLITSTWISSKKWLGAITTPLSSLILRRIATIYGFTSMPPMPPRQKDARDRAIAVRKLIRYVQGTPQPLIGFAPEGMDSLDGRLDMPPVGVGRLMAYLARRGITIIPVGIYEEDGVLCLRIGSPYQLPVELIGLDKEQERLIAYRVMGAISECLPLHLRLAS